MGPFTNAGQLPFPPTQSTSLAIGTHPELFGSHCDSVCGGAGTDAVVPFALELDLPGGIDSAGFAVRQPWPTITKASMTPAAVSLFVKPVKRGPLDLNEKLAVTLHIDERKPTYV